MSAQRPPVRPPSDNDHDLGDTSTDTINSTGVSLIAREKQRVHFLSAGNVERAALAGAGFLADAYDLFVINIGTFAASLVSNSVLPPCLPSACIIHHSLLLSVLRARMQWSMCCAPSIQARRKATSP